MAIPTINSGPVRSVIHDGFGSGGDFSGNGTVSLADNSKTLSLDMSVWTDPAQYIIDSPNFSSGTGKSSSGAADGIIGQIINRTMVDNAIKGPEHVSVRFSTAFPVTSTIGAVSLYVQDGTNGAYFHKADASSYNGGWGLQLFADPSSTPDAGTALSVTASIDFVGAYIDLSNSNENMFECMASSVSWVGRAIQIQGGTSVDPIDFAGVYAEDVKTTYSTISPITGNKFGHVKDEGEGNITIQAPIEIGNSDGTTLTYFQDTSLAISCKGANVNDKWFRFDIRGNTTAVFGDSASATPGTVAGTSLKKLAVDTQTDNPAIGGIKSYKRTWINGRAWILGPNDEFHDGGFNNIEDITCDSALVLNNFNVVQSLLIYQTPPTVGKLTNVTLQSPATYCMQIGTTAFPFTGTTLTIDWKFVLTAAEKTAGMAIYFHLNGQQVDVTFSGVPTENKIDASMCTIDATNTGTLNFPAGATVSVKTTVTAEGSPLQGAVVYLEAASGGDLPVGTVILNGETNASGVVEDAAFAYTSDQPVTGWVRSASGPIPYDQFDLGGDITVNGYAANAIMSED